LARISRLLRDSAVCEKLRKSDDSKAIFSLLTTGAASHAA
jgi:PTS system nitrogen regulatory IIA component